MSPIAMNIMGVLSVVSTVFLIVALISSSTNNGVVKNVSWNILEVKTNGDIDGHAYVGVYKSVFYPKDGHDSSTYFQSAACGPQEYCHKCASAMKVAMSFVAIGVAFSLPSLFTNFMRGTEAGNTNGNQMLGAAASVFTCICGIIAVISDSEGCLKFLKDELGNNDDSTSYDWRYGPAWILVMVALLLKAVEAITNLAIPATSTEYGSTPNPNAGIDMNDQK